MRLLKFRSTVFLWVVSLLCFLVMPGDIAKANETTQKKTVRVGYFNDNDFHVGQGDDELKSGYGYEYYQMVDSVTNWEYEYVYGNWSEVYEAFLEGKVDIMGDVTRTAERETQMLFPELPMGEEFYYIYAGEDDYSIVTSDIHSLDGKKIGVNAGSYNETVLREFLGTNNIDATVVLCSGVEERYEKFKKHEIDCVVSTDGYTMENTRATFRIGGSDYYIAVNKDRPDLLNELNIAMNKIQEQHPDYNDQLKNKYMKKAIVRSSLSLEEREWLMGKSVIKVGYRLDTLPLSHYDEENGEVIGLIADIIDNFSQKMGITFELIGYAENPDMVADLKAGNIDCIFPVIDNSWYSEKNGYRQTFSILTERMAMIYKGQYQGMSEYKKVSYAEGAPAQYLYLLQNKIGEEMLPYPNKDAQLMAVLNGEADCTVMNANGWNYVNKTDSTYSDLGSVILEEGVGYCFAVARDNMMLYSILDKGISQLDSGLVVEAVNKYSQTPADYSFKNFIKHNLTNVLLIIIITLTVIILIIVFAALFIEKTKIEKDNLAYTAEHDSLTGVYNKRAFQRFSEEAKESGINLCLIMVDLDDFKKVNDSYGHEMGDQVLVKVANSLMKMVRAEDKVFRYGGDEFAVLMYGLKANQRELIMRRVAGCEENLSDVSDGFPAVSISAGAAFSENGYSSELFVNADEALYQVKKSGKAGCVVSKKVIKAIKTEDTKKGL